MVPQNSQDAFRSPLARSLSMAYETAGTSAAPAAAVPGAPAGRRLRWNKVPEITVHFWMRGRVTGAALQASAVVGEQAVPALLRLSQKLCHRSVPGSVAARPVRGAGQAQYFLHRVEKTVGGGQRLGQ
ncbi:hypothetical protein GCM10010521_15780 [Streptomyces rameus]|uniref:Uncharacterized protein n=1 Tax=Streptomyces rameus TaxID=68261 RepID=A0ABP6MZ83_9ACTN